MSMVTDLGMHDCTTNEITVCPHIIELVTP